MMNILYNGYHKMKWHSGRLAFFTILNSLLLIFLYSGQVLATVCNTASITASTPTADFVDNGDGTVTHTKTGLMWKQCSEGLSGAACATGTAVTYTWQGALQQAKTLNASGFAGFTDWRLPNIKELASIAELQCNGPSINAIIFPATVSHIYWSASPYKKGIAGQAWYVDFNNGGGNYGYKSSNHFSVRLVRGGQ